MTEAQGEGALVPAGPAALSASVQSGGSTKSWNVVGVSNFTCGNLGVATLGLKLILTIHCSFHHAQQMFWGTFCVQRLLHSVKHPATNASPGPAPCQMWSQVTLQNNRILSQHNLSAQHPAPLLPAVLLH